MNKGKTTLEAQNLLQKYGLNLLPDKNNAPAIKLLLSQFKNAFSIVLIIALSSSFIVGDPLDGVLILLILVLNTILGFWQEYKASKELEALRKFEVQLSRVIRDGKEVEIPSSQIVPGDVVILESGDKIPADGKIIESFTLSVNESILTGESLPVVKTKKSEENSIFFGTIVVSGRAKYEVTQTGLNTRFGLIAESLAQVEAEKTPLEISLSKLVKIIGLVVVIVTLILFTLRLLQGFELSEVFLTSIALMVAAVPEGLPAVVTIILALGIHNMYKRKALVRKMVAVESLGSATVILSDKTGTLTKNEMRVKEVEVLDDHNNDLLKCAVLCNSANLVLKEDGDPKLGDFDILGDTTEGALLIWAKEKGLDIDLLRAEGKLVEEIPFSLEKRKMSVIWEKDGKHTTYTKGAPEEIIKQVKLQDKQAEHWNSKYQQMASKGLRVLAFAKDNNFLGLVGIADQIREEAIEAIKVAKGAGIKVVMVTGDNELTAKSVAEELGLLSEGDEVLVGDQLNNLDDEELKKRIDKIKVFARITPENKLKLVKIYQSLDEVVAVTGDGVNDALALKQAQIGVSMGKIGSDVAKEASDIILLDDNFVTLVAAVEQGRVIYTNILKVIKFLLTGNFAELLLITIASLFSHPSPLLPTQILWINFVSDGLPALSLGFDNPSNNVMKIPPQRERNILDNSMLRYVLIGGITIAGICFIVFWFTHNYFGLGVARGATFTTMVVLQMILPFIIRRHHSLTSNRKLLASVLLMLILQVMILTVPSLKKAFGID